MMLRIACFALLLGFAAASKRRGGPHKRSFEDAEALVAALDPQVRVLPLPPQQVVDGIGGGVGHYGLPTQIALALSNMQPHHRVLEIGCGFGRNARWLGKYLNASEGGRFEGFDIMPTQVDWGTSNLTPLMPHVRFQLAKVHNHFYKVAFDHAVPNKLKSASSYRFPYPDASFDVIVNPSVFTHLLRADLENYVREAARVLKPGGVAAFWFFLLDEMSRYTLTHPELKKYMRELNPYDEVAWATPKHPEIMIAYNESYIIDLLTSAGFERPKGAHSIHKGRWRLPKRAPAEALAQALAHAPVQLGSPDSGQDVVRAVRRSI